VQQSGRAYSPPHLSKDQDIHIAPGDCITVTTPGGGGYGPPFERSPALVARDLRRGYYTADQARELFGVALDGSGAVDQAATERLRQKSGGKSSSAQC
jgi:N-methylhydantoinase B